MLASGIDISEIKKGVKENTLVMTVKCHTHSVPTLFIQHVSTCLRYHTDLDNNLPFKADTKMIGVNEPKE